jgi:hypothetical protein
VRLVQEPHDISRLGRPDKPVPRARTNEREKTFENLLQVLSLDDRRADLNTNRWSSAVTGSPDLTKHLPPPTQEGAAFAQ